MSSVFDRLPTPQDLLSRPAIRKLTETLDRKVVTERVKQYLGDIRSRFEQSPAANVPSLTGLAERIARWIAEHEQLGPQQVINATGDLFHRGLVHPPLAESACSAMASSALCGVPQSGAGNGLDAANRRLAKLLGAESATAANNFSAAVSLMFASLFADRRVLIRRGDVIELADGLRLSDLARDHRVDLVEVGASNSVRADDFAKALESEAAGWLRIGPAAAGGRPDAIPVRPIREKAGGEFAVVDLLLEASVRDWSNHGLGTIPVAGDSLKAGADLVVFPGDRWLGGPAVGIVGGKQALIGQMQHSTQRFAAAVDPIRAAGYDAAVRIHDEPDSAAEKHPLLSLLTTPGENLKSRAERIAPHWSALDGVASADVIEGDNTFLVRVFPKSISVADARQQLASHPQVSVLTVASDEGLQFDLRSVPPRYDAELTARVAELLRGEVEGE